MDAGLEDGDIIVVQPRLSEEASGAFRVLGFRVAMHVCVCLYVFVYVCMRALA